jgi:hypothetical protein
MSNQSELAQLASVFAGSALSNRNLIINGAMQVSQRGSTFTAPDGAYTLDRYQVYQANGAVFDIKTSTDAPDGFEGSLEIDCTTAAASPAAGAYFQMLQRIEGYNVQQLAYGTSSAKKITLSFYVKSNKTGTYQVNFRRSTATAQMANKTYTINSADTWERKSVTVDGATGFSLTGGNAEGLMIDWWYHSGTNFTSGSGSETYIALASTNYNANGTANLGDNTSNYLRMTGVQLEVGDTATPFEHIPYSDQLARCQRYYYLPTACQGGNVATNTDIVCAIYPFSVRMRATPTSSGTSSAMSLNYPFELGGVTGQYGGFEQISVDGAIINYGSLSATSAAGRGIAITGNDVQFDAEL